MAVGHTILIVVYRLLKHRAVYQELGENFFDHLQRDRLARYLVKRLEKLVHKVTLEPHAV